MTDTPGRDIAQLLPNRSRAEQSKGCIHVVDSRVVGSRRHRSLHTVVITPTCSLSPVLTPFCDIGLQLPNHHFEELTRDVYDEVDRRENETSA